MQKKEIVDLFGSFAGRNCCHFMTNLCCFIIMVYHLHSFIAILNTTQCARPGWSKLRLNQKRGFSFKPHHATIFYGYIQTYNHNS